MYMQVLILKSCSRTSCHQQRANFMTMCLILEHCGESLAQVTSGDQQPVVFNATYRHMSVQLFLDERKKKAS